jgi:hypothetical protein
MGSRDKGRKESKKPKKDTRKLPPLTVMTAPAEVEVIKKGKQREGRKMEEEEEAA